MKKKQKYKRCTTHRIVGKDRVYTCRYNINGSLIGIDPPVNPNLMSFYRGTSTAKLWDLASDLEGYVDD